VGRTTRTQINCALSRSVLIAHKSCSIPCRKTDNGANLRLEPIAADTTAVGLAPAAHTAGIAAATVATNHHARALELGLGHLAALTTAGCREGFPRAAKAVSVADFMAADSAEAASTVAVADDVSWFKRHIQ
jgi:hypothetical protein